ncbi:MAG: ATP-dependent helicase, partial [Novipirellula sp. JB048]
MDLMSDDAIAAFGLLVGEAVERLVDEHDESFDKRAAMLTVDSPTLSREGGQLKFEFKVKGNRQPTAATTIEVAAERQTEDEDFDGSPENASFKAVGACACAQFKTYSQCAHTLSTAWWLQEQLGRRGISEVLSFLGELEVDSVSVGREFVDTILSLAEESSRPREAEKEVTRLQWRVGFSRSRYYAPLSITPYEQKPRKNKKGWTKGKEIPGFELLKRDFSAFPIDGKIAALVASRSYSFDEDHYAEFQALQSLVGHPHVGWADGDLRDLEVLSAELSLTLEPVDRELDGDDGEAEIEPGESGLTTHFRPTLHVSGLDLDVDQCEVVMGHCSPVEPVVVLADRKQHRLVICTLRDSRATRVIQFLLKSELHDAVLDAPTAARLAIGCAAVDSLVRVDLPPQLAGPIQPIEGELVFELRPRPGAGLLISLGVHEERFREVLVPAATPEIVPCLTEQGPVRLQRDLKAEQQKADAVVERFGLRHLDRESSYRWVATSDEVALDLLGRLYDGGAETPRIIWPEGQTIRVRGELTPSALRVQIDDKRDWFGFSGSVTIEGQEIPLADLLAAVREDRALVRVGDREFAKISDAFRRRLQQLGDVIVSDRDSM